MTVNNSKWLTLSITLAVATLSAYSVCLWRRKWRDANEKIKKLETSLKAALEKSAAERQGRIRTQQALRKALIQSNAEKNDWQSYPMAPIATVRSCFSTRNGTPRQPLLVPLARAQLTFDSVRVPPSSLEGLEGYSHCWIIYVFHLNTDLEKLWKHPSKSKFKSKVRVPRLKGKTMGVFATRSPHRPCPIGLTVAKVEGIEGQKLLLSGVDLVDGTPVLDVKPYLPYCDRIDEATVPDWVKVDSSLTVASVDFSQEFSASLAESWLLATGGSLYSRTDEFKALITQVLSWDIRSISQRNRPHEALDKAENGSNILEDVQEPAYGKYDELSSNVYTESCISSGNVVYHVILEGMDVSYRIDGNGSVLVEKVSLSSQRAVDNHVSSTAL